MSRGLLRVRGDLCYSWGMSNHRRPLIVATAVLALGVAASLAGNLQAINLDNARPGVGAYISAVLWPLSLFGVVELLIHTPWLATWRDRTTKGAVLVAVAAVAAWISYWHLANVLSHYGYDVASRYAGPVAIDAAMVLAALALDRVVQARRAPLSSDVDTVMDRWGVDKAWTGPVASVQDVAESEAALRGQRVHMSTDALPPSDMDTQDLSDVQGEVDNAVDTAGRELASETEDWLANLSKRVQPIEPTPAVPVVPGGRSPARPTTERVVIADRELADLVAAGMDAGVLTVGQQNELLAGWYGVSTKTIRRRRDALGLNPTSGPPAA